MTISTLDFYANNIGGTRTPGAAVVPPVDPGDFEGVAYSSTQSPILSRVGHSNQTYVQPGQQVVLTFRSNIKATLMPLYGFMDMIEDRHDDGKTITITWNVPSDQPGVSWYFGCRAKTSGGESELYTIVHIGKSESDVITFGKGTSKPILRDAINDPSLGQGCTLVIKKGFYEDVNDTIRIGNFGGYINASGQYQTLEGSLSFPNGVHTFVQHNGQDIANVTNSHAS